MTPSKYQQAIYDAHATGGTTIAAHGVAGCGKSHVLENSLPLRPDRAVYFAFNRHIVEAAKARLANVPDLTVTTINAWGMRALYEAAATKLSVDTANATAPAQKYMRLCLNATNNIPWAKLAYTRAWDCAVDLRKLVEWARLTLATESLLQKYGDVTPEHIEQHALQAGLVCPPDLSEAIADILWEGAKIAEDKGIIDFTDQLYLPARWHLPVTRFPLVFVDELQDLNQAQLALILATRAEGATGIMAGDKNQSIMGWVHAGGAVFDDAIARTNATSLPLSICYRCPTSHLDLARKLVPHIEARPDAPEGVVEHCSDGQFLDEYVMREGDMILCRTTAPLITACLDLLRAKVPARVKGRDIGSDIAGTLRMAASSNMAADIPGDLDRWLARKLQQLDAQNAPDEQRAAAIDKVDSARAAYEGLYPCGSVAELVAKVQGIFSDNGGGVMLSTIHRAKGLEADRVFILRPDLLTTDTQEETNVKYVALTRAREVLGFIEPEGDPT